MRFRPSPRRVRFLAVVALLLAVPFAAFASVLPRLAPPDQFGADKFLHAGAFLLFAVLCVLSAPSGRWLTLSLGLLALFGGGIEVVQTLIPGRQGSPIDFLADLTGVIIGAYVATNFLSRFRLDGQGSRFRL